MCDGWLCYLFSAAFAFCPDEIETPNCIVFDTLELEVDVKLLFNKLGLTVLSG